jgi:hypothetical protein
MDLKTEAETPTAEPAKWITEIETWFSDLRVNLNSVLDTEAHNKLYAAKEALKARLAAIL